MIFYATWKNKMVKDFIYERQRSDGGFKKDAR
jgi:hypothetical protein